MVPILAALPSLPRRAGIALKARLQRMETIFIQHYLSAKWHVPPSDLIKHFRLIANLADKLDQAITSDKFRNQFETGLEKLLRDSWRDLVRRGRFPATSHQVPAPFKYVYDGNVNVYVPDPWFDPGRYTLEHYVRIAQDVLLVRDSALECIEFAKRWTKNTRDMRRHRKSAEAHLLDMIFQLLAHYHRIFPKTLGKKLGRTFDAYAEGDHERGRLVLFTKAVYSAMQARNRAKNADFDDPDLDLRDITAAAIANAFRRWKRHPSKPIPGYLSGKYPRF